MKSLLIILLISSLSTLTGIVRGDDKISISSKPFLQQTQKNSTRFDQLEGPALGLHTGYVYEIRDYTDPFWIGRGTASGDYNNDGWTDLIFGSNKGFILYKNTGGRFEQVKHNSPNLESHIVYAVAFVDFDNNGWMDIFFTTFNQGNYVIFNHEGEFDFTQPKRIPNNHATLTLSPAFADLDLDGRLDILNGNISLGVVTGFHHVSKGRNNSIVFNGGTEFRDVELESYSGETMATLITDLNNDGVSDLYMGNDFFFPDKILLGSGRGYTQVKGNQFLAYTPFYSMGADSGDLNNDLQLDFVVMGTMNSAPNIEKHDIDGVSPNTFSEFKGHADTCRNIKQAELRKQCESVRRTPYIYRLEQKRFRHISDCEKKSNQQECLTELMWWLITDNPAIEDCSRYFAQDIRLREICSTLTHLDREYERRDMYGSIPQDDRNLLYYFDTATNTFTLQTNFKHPGGWTWGSRIVDLDNDGWQDIFNSEGAVRKSGYGWNVFMKNLGGHRFEQKQFSANLTNDFGLYSFTLIDYDNDGDLDIIGNGAEGPIQIYRNNIGSSNNSLAVSLKDRQGNLNSIGAKVIIEFKDKTRMIREIKSSGGYQSFDSPTAWFGLGQKSKIESIKVIWPDNRVSRLNGPFPAGNHYTFIRH